MFNPSTIPLVPVEVFKTKLDGICEKMLSSCNTENLHSKIYKRRVDRRKVALPSKIYGRSYSLIRIEEDGIRKQKNR